MEIVLANHLLEPLNTLTVIKGDWLPVRLKKKEIMCIPNCTAVLQFPLPTELIALTCRFEDNSKKL